MQKAKRAPPVPVSWWQPPFQDSPDPAVRRAWSEFLTYKRGAPYSVGESLEYMQRFIPQRAAASSTHEINSSHWRMTLSRFLREMRA
jgi:hypothetical protein